MEIFYIFVAAAFSNNYVLSHLLGIYPAATEIKDRDIPLLWEGLTITITALVLALLGAGIHTWILEPLELSYMLTIVVMILLYIIAHFVVLLCNRMGNYNDIGIMPGYVISNSIILAVILFSIDFDSITLPALVGRALGAGAGYTLISILLADIMDKIEEDAIVPAFRGLPIKLISLGLIGYAFWGLCCLSP